METTILHITKPEFWGPAWESGSYEGDTLHTEGFIHCSTPAQLAQTANRFFAGQHGLLLLNIDPQKVTSEIRYEESGGQLFPHIYGPLNIEAVQAVLPFEPGENGRFTLPEQLLP